MEKVKTKKKKKKLTLDDVIALKHTLSNYIETGFVGLNDEESSRVIAKDSLESLFSYIEELKPRVKRKSVIIKGYENDEELLSAKYNIQEVLTSFDRSYEQLYQRKPNYKTDLIAPTKAKLICQRMHIFLRNSGVKEITSELVTSQVCGLFGMIILIPWARQKYALPYIETAFDSIILEAIKVKQNIKQQAEMLTGGF